MKRIQTFWPVALIVLFLGAVFALQARSAAPLPPTAKAEMHFTVTHTNAQWRKILTEAQYNILRQAGTDIPFHNTYWNNHAKGEYVCAACGQPLFSSKTKFESGTGWPSFWAPIAKDSVLTRDDSSLDMSRNEVICARCGSHLGHVFDDGPKPTGLRYCMDSTAMKFIPTK